MVVGCEGTGVRSIDRLMRLEGGRLVSRKYCSRGGVSRRLRGCFSADVAGRGLII